MDIKEQILVALGLDKGEEVVMAYQAKSEDGTIFVSTADELAVGVDISVLTEAGYDDEKEEMAEAVEFAFPETDAEKADWAKSYEEMKDKVDNLIDAVADLKRDKDGGDDEVEEMSEEVVEPSTNPKSIKTTEVVEFSAEDELKKLKAENEKLKTELAESPASAPLDTNKFSSDRPTPTAQDFRRMTSKEKFLYNLNK